MGARQKLWDVAVDQYGYVTARDARSLGLPKPTVDMLVARGQLEQVAYGVYRFPQLPASSYDPYMLAVLWTGVPSACLSHDTALAVYELCDINPDRIHMSVPAGKRIRRAGGELYKLHYEDLTAGQIDWWQQVPTVTIPVAISQSIASGVPTYLLRQAIDSAERTGAVSLPQGIKFTALVEARDAR